MTEDETKAAQAVLEALKPALVAEAEAALAFSEECGLLAQKLEAGALFSWSPYAVKGLALRAARDEVNAATAELAK